jgi:hypothetical protein
LPGASATRGPAGSEEFEHDAFTILFVPTPFWSFLPIVVNGKSLDDHAHQTIPAYFMRHARFMSLLV